MRIETPEGNMQRASEEDRLLDRIENKIACLTEELAEVKKQLAQGKKCWHRRKLREREQRLEHELQQARLEEKCLTQSIFGGNQ